MDYKNERDKEREIKKENRESEGEEKFTRIIIYIITVLI